jgi:hypothetical protein
MLPSRVAVVSFLTLVSAAGCGAPAREEPVAEGGSELTLAELPIRLTGIAGGTFDQAVDHASESAGLGTFKQRYWYSTQFATGPDAPVLFFICPESECAASELTALGDTAKVLKAAVVALEHRYYGTSMPFEHPTLEQMKYLTIDNALEDLASFERFARTDLALSGKWIALGGSYPGMLAAFYREKHPELVVGAWASSAPVDIQEAVWGYDAIAAQALGPSCTRLFKSALDYATDAFDDDAKRNELAVRATGRPYPLPPGIDAATRAFLKAQFTSWISSLAMSAAQAGRTHKLCSALAQHSEQPVDGLIGYMNPPLVAEDSDAQQPAPGGPPVSAPAGAYIAGSWFYQTCTEVGFFRIPNPDREESILSELHTVDLSRIQCAQYVGQQPRIAETRARYLAPIAKGEVTNLYFVNGSLDPWSVLSYTDQATAPAGVTTKVIALGSHGTDLENLTPNSTLGVFEAHKQLVELARQWLAQ